jgi:hypothetical protein
MSIDSGRKKGKTESVRRILIWIVGILLSVIFVGALLPLEGPPGHQWLMPFELVGLIFLLIGGFGILFATHLLDK